MLRAILVAALLSALASVLPSAALAESMHCDGRLVSPGDSAVTLRARCGEPDHLARYPIARRSVASATTLGADAVREEVQLWTYQGDPGDLWRLVTVRRGLVESVRVLGRPGSKARGCVRAGLFRDRATVGVVRLTCGAPVDRSRWIEERASSRGGGTVTLVVRERWVYDPGPGRLLRVLEFANGELVDVRTAERSPS